MNKDLCDLIVYSGLSHPSLAKRIVSHLDLPLGRSQSIVFSNENIMVRLQDNCRQKDVFVIQTSSSPVNDHLVELLILLDAIKYASAARVTAVLPYFPYGRSDKKDEPRISIAARLVADLLQTAGADRVLTMNLHSPQIQGFFRIPVDQLLAAPIFFDYFNETLFMEESKEDFVLVMGDAGAAKAFGYYSDELNLPVAIVDKFRPDHSEKPIIRQIIGDVRGKSCLIVDDEITSGGTLIEAAERLSAEGAKRIFAAAVHPVLSGDAVKKLVASPIERIIVGDTVPVREKIKGHENRFAVLDLSPLFAKAILSIHNGSSISALFPPSVRRRP
ncbi:MAG: ribose-phosphate diphosphokinase [Myxococcota bacterium]|jgi:ribose-phosphate pyrophosphokinase|nr:ribose-phosphate pyrophosphokinase [Myxococcota bacterium]HRR74140.1 ribose-phosphate pyrophosphokinase [Myxococcota bacterium]HRV17693.1 ribose-phosphate pyrophosphokinase [Myxococcota bacterium]